jgi:hypothetical protein
MTTNEYDKPDHVEVDVEIEGFNDAPPPSQHQNQPTSPVAHAGEMLNLDEHQLPMAGVVFSAVIFLIAVTSKGGPDNGTGYFVYGIILSVLAMFCALVALGLTHKPELVQDRPDLPKYVNQFLFTWTFAGACVMTFGSGPFVFTSNGYFAAWGMAIFAIYGIGVSLVDTVQNAGSMMVHLAASIIVIIALASGNGSFDDFKGESVFGMVLACLSAVLMMYHVRSERAGGGNNDDDGGGLNKKKGWFIIMAIFAIMWIVAASLMTFRGPFLHTGNGYFGAWGGAVTAVSIAMAMKSED